MNWITMHLVEPEIGETYGDKVVKMMELDVFVNFFGSKDGLVHISEREVLRVATPAGFEPATPCLEGRCSIQLSYGIDQCDQGTLRSNLKLSA